MKKRAKNIKKTEEIGIKPEDFQLNDTDKKVLTYKLEYPELKQKEIAQLLGLTEQTISVITNKPAFVKAYRLLTLETLEYIKETKKEAAKTLRSLLKAKSEYVRAKVSVEFLKNELGMTGKEDDSVSDDLTFEGWE